MTLSKEELREQRELEKKKFQRWAILFPMVIVTLLAIVGFFVLSWFAIGEDVGRTADSAIADIIIITTILIPLSLIGLGVVGALFWLVRKRKQHGSYVRKPVSKGLQKADSFVQTAEEKLVKHQPKIVDPVVKINARFSYFGSLVRNLKDNFFRSK